MNDNKQLFSDMWGLPAKKKRNRNYNTVDYEWDIEITNNETEDIEDHWFADKLKDKNTKSISHIIQTVILCWF